MILCLVRFFAKAHVGWSNQRIVLESGHDWTAEPEVMELFLSLEDLSDTLP